MDDELICIPVDDKQYYPLFELRILVEKFRQYVFGTHQLIFEKSSIFPFRGNAPFFFFRVAFLLFLRDVNVLVKISVVLLGVKIL